MLGNEFFKAARIIFIRHRKALGINKHWEIIRFKTMFRNLLLSSRNPRVLANRNPWYSLFRIFKNHFTMSDTPAIANKRKNLTAMGKAVKESCGENTVTNDVGPAVEALV